MTTLAVGHLSHRPNANGYLSSLGWKSVEDEIVEKIEFMKA